MSTLPDGVTMSAKKGAIVKIGGVLAMNDEALYQRARSEVVPRRGCPTYGGLARHALDAIAIGPWAGLQEHHLAYRIGHRPDRLPRPEDPAGCQRQPGLCLGTRSGMSNSRKVLGRERGRALTIRRWVLTGQQHGHALGVRLARQGNYTKSSDVMVLRWLL